MKRAQEAQMANIALKQSRIRNVIPESKAILLKTSQNHQEKAFHNTLVEPRIFNLQHRTLSLINDVLGQARNEPRELLLGQMGQKFIENFVPKSQNSVPCQASLNVNWKFEICDFKNHKILSFVCVF